MSTARDVDRLLRIAAEDVASTDSPLLSADIETSYGVKRLAWNAIDNHAHLDARHLLRYVDSVRAFAQARSWEISDDLMVRVTA